MDGKRNSGNSGILPIFCKGVRIPRCWRKHGDFPLYNIIYLVIAVFILMVFLMISTGCIARKKIVFMDNTKVMVKVGAAEIIAEVARSNVKRHAGLGGREKLNPGEGMLFVFDRPANILLGIKTCFS